MVVTYVSLFKPVSADFLVVVILVPITGYIMTKDQWKFSNLSCKGRELINNINKSVSENI